MREALGRKRGPLTSRYHRREIIPPVALCGKKVCIPATATNGNNLLAPEAEDSLLLNSGSK